MLNVAMRAVFLLTAAACFSCASERAAPIHKSEYVTVDGAKLYLLVTYGHARPHNVFRDRCRECGSSDPCRGRDGVQVCRCRSIAEHNVPFEQPELFNATLTREVWRVAFSPRGALDPPHHLQR